MATPLNAETVILARLDAMIIKEAEQIEAELKEELSEEAKTLHLEQTAWTEVTRVILQLRTALEYLVAARNAGGSGKPQLLAAEGILTAEVSKIAAIEAQIITAIKMDAHAKNIAKKIVTELKKMHDALQIEASKIKTAKSW